MRPVSEIDLPSAAQYDPIISRDGRTLYFVSDRIPGGGVELFEITRPDLDSSFEGLGRSPDSA